MKQRLLFTFALASLAASMLAAEPPAKTDKKTGPVNWLWQHVPVPKFGGKPKAGANWNDLQLTIAVQPAKPKLSETKRLTVALHLTNQGRKLVQLEFPTSQKIEVLVKNAAGKQIEKWSEDQPVSNEPTMVSLNPGERLEYSAAIATREMVAGQSYTIEGFFPRYEQLRTSKTITPDQ